MVRSIEPIGEGAPQPVGGVDAHVACATRRTPAQAKTGLRRWVPHVAARAAANPLKDQLNADPAASR